MVLQLHVWGPAFGLPSIDAECIAAIAYLAQTVSPADYQLIQSSPSAVPTQHLPALYNPSSSTWTSGFSSITTHLLAHPPSPPQKQKQPTTPHPPTTTTTTTQTADSTAYTAFLTAHAAPLLSLSLYVSSANYSTTTRPAYSALLPLPLPWTEPPALRAAHARRAAPLGLSALDTDSVRARERAERDRLAAEGWVTVPEGLQEKKGVGAALSAEQKMRIRLEGVAAGVLDVLGEVEWEGQGLAVRCLAFGYLVLMLVPEVPRPWLREVMEGRYGGLCEFVRGFRGEVFPEGRMLPWVEEGQDVSAVAVGMRFVRGVLGEVPLVGEYWSQWWTARKKREVLASRGAKVGSSGDLLLFLGAGLGLTAMGAGAFFYRGLPPFGEAVQVWRKPVVSLSSFGAAGAMFSGALYGID
ncbi:outer mitochondrial membrane transport complex protein-domain-containing protein [Chaetomium fimeti]|uniref:Outer mitochondrial membrane transport complex protein-domain-containing protein n=1 Tax=Chaetomium fimeti TaxID=1854472 RepID=A0AAE0HQJ6_9PEZI|nr:outer mitochondrial membrane transport complex protein-domain-containing protein [Chaetomium fimeti]